MPSFILTATDSDGTVTTKTFDSEFLGDTVEKVEDFLHGVGFCFEELSCTYSDDNNIPNEATRKPTRQERIDTIYNETIRNNVANGIE